MTQQDINLRKICPASLLLPLMSLLLGADKDGMNGLEQPKAYAGYAIRHHPGTQLFRLLHLAKMSIRWEMNE